MIGLIEATKANEATMATGKVVHYQQFIHSKE
jgi:hypothetical protein